MIKEDFCSFEVAKLLKEKGFNEKCRGSYHSEFDDNDNPIVMLEEWTAQPYNNDFVDEGFLCSAPTHQMAMKWLRENSDITISIFPTIETDMIVREDYNYAIYKNKTVVYQSCSTSYEDAVEAALKYSLERLI